MITRRADSRFRRIINNITRREEKASKYVYN